ncbi:hypothetical protein BC829DRAFT_407717 [Chytridium lagenaria]|nr:hypothetical protein BC829DRAFT_407717 [Chytridium lagenaria]
MPFGTDLWDQWREVETYCNEGVHSMMNINEFMKRRAEIEADYAKNLQRLVKPYKDELTKKMADKKAASYNKALLSSTMMQGWSQLLNQTENEAAREKGMEATMVALDKATKNPKSTEKEQENLRLEVERKGATASSIMESYQQSMTETNNLKNKLYRITIPNILDEVQKEDESSRISISKIGLVTYYELLAAQQPGIIGCLESMNNVFQLINAEYDSDLFIKMMRTGTPLPADYAFDEKVAVKDFTARRPTTRSRSESKDDDETIFALPGKKGRKLAADKVKIYDKEISEAERKKQGVETLISVYEQQATKDPKYVQDLQSQKATFDVKIDNAGLKRHRLLVYIAEVDKSPAPELPSHLVGKSIQVASSPDREFLSSPSRMSVNAGTPQEESVSRQTTSAMSPADNAQWGGERLSESAAAVVFKAKMIYDFEAAPGSQEVSAFAGEEVDILEQQDDGWWKGRIVRNGEVKEGYIPGNYTEPV